MRVITVYHDVNVVRLVSGFTARNVIAISEQNPYPNTYSNDVFICSTPEDTVGFAEWVKENYNCSINNL